LLGKPVCINQTTVAFAKAGTLFATNAAKRDNPFKEMQGKNFETLNKMLNPKNKDADTTAPDAQNPLEDEKKASAASAVDAGRNFLTSLSSEWTPEVVFFCPMILKNGE